MTVGTWATDDDIALALSLRRRQQQAGVVWESAVWTPQHRPGCGEGTDCECPQVLAYNSEADVLGYGGAAGAGKTDLALGLAGMKHRRSIILRREFPQVRAMIERSRALFNAGNRPHGKDSYNESLHIWRLADGRQIEFGSCQYEKDKEDFRGRDYDLHVFDEATQFSESMIQFITAWNRTTIEGLRCQILLTFNPPDTPAGRWVIRYFLPWIAFLFPDLEECKRYKGTPALPGELRWFLSEKGLESEVPPDTPQARSRTFIPGRVEDNRYLMERGYDATLEALPEPSRSRMRYGSFTAGLDNAAALWKRKWIEDKRETKAPDLFRIVTAIDPSATETGDEAGIVTAGSGWCSCKGKPEIHAFVLSDDSAQAHPSVWAGGAVTAFHKYKADSLIAESNNGGQMVSVTIGTIPNAPRVKLITASRGKHTRAEPISMLYEQGMVHHVGSFAQLENEQCSWVPGMLSPNRMDALVWALTELQLGGTPGN